LRAHCLGAGIDLVTACDIRLASADATFGVRETKIGMVADVGTLQRLPRTAGGEFAAMSRASVIAAFRTASASG
jgi:enoyl-CoA hydratase/carnithine racemase